MYWAAERRGGKIVHADKARKYGDYRCPTCKAEVFLRSGAYRENHFAHMPGQAKPDCEEFHYSGDLARLPSAPVLPQELKHVDPLLLSIELEPETQKRAARKWRLCLTVPKAPDARGQIAITLGKTDTRKISLTKLALAPETYTVDPGTEDFAASWVSHEVRPEYRDVVQHRVSGLDRLKANAFAATRLKHKPRTYSLFWGQSYYLVWSSERPIALPTELPSKPLAQVTEWHCVLVALPHEPAPSVEAWFHAHTDVTIARATRDWALVYPAPYALGAEGDLRIPSNTQIVFALKSAGTDEPSHLTLSAQQQPIELELAGAPQHLILIRGNNKSADAHIHIAWDGAYVTTLATKPYSSTTPSNSIRIACCGPSGTLLGEMHHAAGQRLLTDIRAGTLRLLSLQGHPSVHGRLRVRQGGAPEWQEHALLFIAPAANPATGRLSDEAIELLNSSLQDTWLEVECDFGPYGWFAANAREKPKVLAETSQDGPKLPPALRARIEWLSRACGRYVDFESRPLRLLNDSSLLKHFDRLRIPPEFFAHRNAINAQLRSSQRRSA